MKVSLFATCLANAFYPEMDMTMAKILQHLGREPNSSSPSHLYRGI